MKTLKLLAISAAVAFSACVSASAQIYQIVNQGTDMLQNALMGGLNYRGMVDVSYVNGIGNLRVNQWEITTTQGFKYASWFYMGLGAGANIIRSHHDADWQPGDNNLTYSNTSVMIPLFTDFRFTIGKETSTSFFIDARVGASFLVGKDYVQIGDGYINQSECFYLKPSLGVRIPISSGNSKMAMNIAASYNLLTTDYWSSYTRDLTLNGLGVTLGFEW